MLTFEVLDEQKRRVDSIEIGTGVFDVEPSPEVVHSAVVMQRASARQGTASTLGRGEVRGSGRKPWKQKHTGRARAGSIRSPIWRHGGIVFGPRPRKYGFSIPQKNVSGGLTERVGFQKILGRIGGPLGPVPP